MMKHWQQIEQEAKDNIARIQSERSEAVRSQQIISRYIKAVIRAVKHLVSEEKVSEETKTPGIIAASEKSNRLEDWQRIGHRALAGIKLYHYT
jgi:uncharacterized damage-inducible protein DinB